ncbi:MAG: hydrolase [Firmicutes bacterium]|nr:hydrolase [[Eubacterium] siraeum]MCM1488577.1 hydrolase [Bacillota bacterium]
MSNKGYDCYLDKCLLPVAPKQLQISGSSGNRTVSLINGEQINILKKGELSQIDFTCLIPQVSYPFGKEFRGGGYYLDYFESLRKSGRPFQFIVYRETPGGKRLFNSNITVSLEDYEAVEEAENGFDITVKITLKQYWYRSTAVLAVNGGVKEQRADSTVQAEKPVTIGCSAIVNGRLYGTSYGDAPGQTRTNYRGKINFINLKGSHPYHVTTPEGLWQGWVAKECVRAVS